jgi:hypothetical protein
MTRNCLPWNEAFLGQLIEFSADESFSWTPTSNACSKQVAAITPMLYEAHINERVSLGLTTPLRLTRPLAFTHSTITQTLASSDIEQHMLYQIYCSLTVCWQRCCHCFRNHSAWSSLTTIARYATVSILAIKARLTQSTAQQSTSAAVPL